MGISLGIVNSKHQAGVLIFCQCQPVLEFESSFNNKLILFDRRTPMWGSNSLIKENAPWCWGQTTSGCPKEI